MQSGLVVNTTAEWDADTDTFVINTPNDGAKKNWISQGFTADKAVVMASQTPRGTGAAAPFVAFYGVLRASPLHELFNMQ